MSKKNSNLHEARRAKNDEFYTLISDIEKEVVHYREHLKDKVIFLNCDDDTKSNFWKFFKLNMEFLGIKKLIGTHYDPEKPTYKIEISKNQDGVFVESTTHLEGNGDFRSPECVEILQGCDLVITNPPFSLFREYVSLLSESGKYFLIVGPKNAITYKEIFSLIKNNSLWLGVNLVNNFTLPSGENGTAPALWFTNLNHGRRNEKLDLIKPHRVEDYPTYDNYNAIEVSKVVDIPKDYEGVMGVPITFLTKYNPNQFELVGTSDRGGDDVAEVDEIRLTEKKMDSCYVNGKKVYKRLFIKRK